MKKSNVSCYEELKYTKYIFLRQGWCKKVGHEIKFMDSAHADLQDENYPGEPTYIIYVIL